MPGPLEVTTGLWLLRSARGGPESKAMRAEKLSPASCQSARRQHSLPRFTDRKSFLTTAPDSRATPAMPRMNQRSKLRFRSQPAGATVA